MSYPAYFCYNNTGKPGGCGELSEFRERRVNPYMALGQKKKRTKRLSSLAIFLLAFVLFVTVFGGLCLWAVVKINEQRRVGAGDSSSAPISTDPAATFTE